jgi:hypothetical protein
MLWQEQCAILDINDNLEQLHTATSAMWNHLRGGQNPALHNPLNEDVFPSQSAAW